MAALFRDLVIFAGILAAVTIVCGCVAVNVGDAAYTGENLSVTVDNTGAPSDVYVQVTIFRISGFTQEEYLVVSDTFTLLNGKNRIILPANLPAGRYKLYIYIIQDGVRKTAVIRDIGV